MVSFKLSNSYFFQNCKWKKMSSSIKRNAIVPLISKFSLSLFLTEHFILK